MKVYSFKMIIKPIMIVTRLEWSHQKISKLSNSKRVDQIYCNHPLTYLIITILGQKKYQT